jgi:hypothetical protein
MAANNHSNLWRIGLVAVIAIAIAATAVKQNFTGRAPNPDMTAFGTLLATLLFASAILERALDVWLSLTMGGEADRLDTEIRSLKSKIESSTPDVKTAQEANLAPLFAARAAHQGATRRLATPVALTAGMIISAIGLRSLQPLFVPGDPAWLASPQGHIFGAIDILVTGTLLAGGSDGIHWIVALYRDTMDKNRSTKS